MPLWGRNCADSTRRIVSSTAARIGTLSIGDRGPQVLNFDEAFADEDYLSNFRNSGHPGIADELRVQSE